MNTQKTSPHTPAWTAPDLADPHAAADKPDRVRRMFAAIAPRYDLNNRLHSLWRDQAWRRFAVRWAQVPPGATVVDVACGTGDLTECFAKSSAERVIGVDFTQEMLDIATRRRQRLPNPAQSRVEYLLGDAMNLPLPDNTADVLSIAFGIRNVADPAAALAEFRRVLRPGGRLVILEFASPRNPLVRWFNNLYCKRIMPITATLISGDRSGAYRYLPASVESFLQPDQLCGLLRKCGFEEAEFRPLTLGICACYRAVTPAGNAGQPTQTAEADHPQTL